MDCKVFSSDMYTKFLRFMTSVRPKLGIGYSVSRKYRYQSRNFLFRNRNFFFLIFPNFFMYFCFLWEYEFLKTWNWTQTFKSYLKVTETMTKPLTKPVSKPVTNQVTKQVTIFDKNTKNGQCVVEAVVSVSVTVSAESIGQLEFRFRYRTESKIVVSVVH